MSINPKIRRKLKMLFPKRQSEISFYQWMLENWAIEGGLIPQATAARLINVSKARITQMIKEGKLKELRFENQIFVPYSDTMRYAREKVYQKMRKAMSESLQGIEKKVSDNIFKEMEQGIAELLNKSQDIPHTGPRSATNFRLLKSKGDSPSGARRRGNRANNHPDGNPLPWRANVLICALRLRGAPPLQLTPIRFAPLADVTPRPDQNARGRIMSTMPSRRLNY